MDDEIFGVRSERMPSDADFSSEWRMVRTPTNGRSLSMVIFSDDMLGMRTHHWMRRTGPCFVEGCEPCDRGQVSRWYGYVLGQLQSGERIIFEFPPPAAKQLDDAFKKYGTMRGLCVVASRTSDKFNAKVHLQEKGLWSQSHVIKAVPPTWPVLARIWGVKLPAHGTIGPLERQAISEAEMISGPDPYVVHRRRATEQDAHQINRGGDATYVASAADLIAVVEHDARRNGGSIDRVNNRHKK